MVKINIDYRHKKKKPKVQSRILYSARLCETTLWPLYRGGCSSGVWLLWKLNLMFIWLSLVRTNGKHELYIKASMAARQEDFQWVC